MRKVTISLDYDNILKEIHIESAAFAMLTMGSEPDTITDNNKEMMHLLIALAVNQVAHNIVGFICEELTIPDSGLTEIPLGVESTNFNAQLCRHIIERAVKMHVLSNCYAADPEMQKHFNKCFTEAINDIRIILAMP